MGQEADSSPGSRPRLVTEHSPTQQPRARRLEPPRPPVQKQPTSATSASSTSERIRRVNTPAPPQETRETAGDDDRPRGTSLRAALRGSPTTQDRERGS